MLCFGTCHVVGGVWTEPIGVQARLIMWPYARSLVTTATTTHSPEHQDTTLLMHMLSTYTDSGAMKESVHIRTGYGLADTRITSSVSHAALINTVESGVRFAADHHPFLRQTLPPWAGGHGRARPGRYPERDGTRLVRQQSVPRIRRYGNRARGNCPAADMQLPLVRCTLRTWGNADQEQQHERIVKLSSPM